MHIRNKDCVTLKGQIECIVLPAVESYRKICREASAVNMGGYSYPINTLY